MRTIAKRTSRVTAVAVAPAAVNGKHRALGPPKTYELARDWLACERGGWGVDKLFAHPFDEIEMALSVAVELGQISARDAQLILQDVRRWRRELPAAVDAIDTVCRQTMTARKAGKMNLNGHAKRRK